MFCPSCGSEERQASQFCRACGTDLRVVRVSLETPDSITASAVSADAYRGRSILDRFRLYDTYVADDVSGTLKRRARFCRRSRRWDCCILPGPRSASERAALYPATKRPERSF